MNNNYQTAFEIRVQKLKSITWKLFLRLRSLPLTLFLSASSSSFHSFNICVAGEINGQLNSRHCIGEMTRVLKQLIRTRQRERRSFVYWFHTEIRDTLRCQSSLVTSLIQRMICTNHSRLYGRNGKSLISNERLLWERGGESSENYSTSRAQNDSTIPYQSNSPLASPTLPILA